MKATTITNGQGLESTQNNVGETHNNKSNTELTKRERRGPFEIVTIADKTFVGIGQYRLTEPTTKEKCEEWIKEITWAKIMCLTHVMIEADRKFNNLPPEQQEHLRNKHLKKETIEEIKGL